MRLKIYLLLAIILSACWYTDRTIQYNLGKQACTKELLAAQEKYMADADARYKKQLDDVAKAVTDATKTLEALKSKKQKSVERTRVITKTIPADCVYPPAAIVRDYNEALDSLQRR